MGKLLAVIITFLAFSPLLTDSETPGVPSGPSVQEVATGLVAPWALAFAPDGSLYLTERPGRIRVIRQGVLQETPLADINVTTIQGGESGLLGLALDPDFANNRQLCVYYTYSDAQGVLWNRVSRLTESSGRLGSEHFLLDRIKGGALHDGGRLKIGPDGKLYVTTGDAREGALAQDSSSLNGKILRVNLDGTIPDDNPLPDSPFYSYGHRNPQGLAWNQDGLLVESEHGPAGNDEINLIEKGKNYGWPNVTGTAGNPAFVDPVVSTGRDTWAPSGITFYTGTSISDWTGRLLVATLAGQHLQVLQLDLTRSRVLSSEAVLSGVFGRLRDVVEGPDGFVYIATSNMDGRGSPNPGDDKILRIVSSRDLPTTSLQFSGYLAYVALGLAVVGVIVSVNWWVKRRSETQKTSSAFWRRPET